MMKKQISILIIICFAVLSQAQTSFFNNQLLVRNAIGEVLINQDIDILVSIYDDENKTNLAFSEEHNASSNSFGIVNISIGIGNKIQSSIDSLDWDKETYYINMQVDILDGKGYKDLGTQQLLSVPYAFYAHIAGDVLKLYAGDGISFSDPVFTNTAKDQIVTITGGNNISITPNYPEFTISSYNYQAEEQALFTKKSQDSISTLSLMEQFNLIINDTINYQYLKIDTMHTLIKNDSIWYVQRIIEFENEIIDSIDALKNRVNDSLNLIVFTYKDEIAADSANLQAWMNTRKSEVLSILFDNENLRYDEQVEIDNLFRQVNYQVDSMLNYKGYFIDNRDSNKYCYAKLGSYIWMTEDLRYYTIDSEFIQETGDPDSYDEKYRSLGFGRMYKWIDAMGFDVMTPYDDTTFLTFEDHRGICPFGWHIPKVTEWNNLFAAYSDNAKPLLKDASFEFWITKPSVTASGFDALGGGYYDFTGNKTWNKKSEVRYWAADNSGSNGNYVNLEDDSSTITKDDNSKTSFGYYIRCVKD